MHCSRKIIGLRSKGFQTHCSHHHSQEHLQREAELDTPFFSPWCPPTGHGGRTLAGPAEKSSPLGRGLRAVANTLCSPLSSKQAWLCRKEGAVYRGIAWCGVRVTIQPGLHAQGSSPMGSQVLGQEALLSRLDF